MRELSDKEYKGNADAYRAGFRKGDAIGLDHQIGRNTTQKLG